MTLFGRPTYSAPLSVCLLSTYPFRPITPRDQLIMDFHSDPLPSPLPLRLSCHRGPEPSSLGRCPALVAFYDEITAKPNSSHLAPLWDEARKRQVNGVRGGKKAANGQSLVLTFWNFVQILAGRPVCPSIRPIYFGGEERTERTERSRGCHFDK